MILKNNDAELGKANNLQDLTINFIYKEIGLFINKVDFDSNQIIPETLRGYHELMSAFKTVNEADSEIEKSDKLEKFIKYISYRIRAEFDQNKIHHFARLENCNDEILSVLVLSNLIEIVNIENEREEIYLYVLKSINPYNISISDILLSFDFAEQSLNSNDYDNKKFLNYLKIYVSARYLKANSLTIKNLLAGGIISEYYEIFPKEINDFLRRDYIQFENIEIILNNSMLSSEGQIWLSSFIQSVGKVDPSFRLGTEKIFERKARITSFKSAVFSPLNPIVSVFSIKNDLDIFLELDFESTAFKDIDKWITENEEFKKSLTNICFLKEFLEEFNTFTLNYREPHLIYSKTVYDYIFKCLPKTINKLKTKYQFLNHYEDDFLLHNPFFTYWKNNFDECNKIIDLVYSNRSLNFGYSDHVISIANNALIKYSRYFERPNNNSSQGTKQAMNYLVKLFAKEPDIHRDLVKHRRLMDRQLGNGLNNIHNLLLKITNG